MQAELDDKRRVRIARERQVLKECDDRAARLNSEVRDEKWKVGGGGWNATSLLWLLQL